MDYIVIIPSLFVDDLFLLLQLVIRIASVTALKVLVNVIQRVQSATVCQLPLTPVSVST